MADFSSALASMDAAIKAAFGVSATYKPKPLGDTFSITGVRIGPVAQEETAIAGRIGFWVLLSDFTLAPKKGDQVTIGGKLYTVFEINADLEGGAMLALEEN